MPPKTLAIDFGTKRIGLAISVATLADPYQIIPNDQQTIPTIKRICLLENIKQILVGLSENETAQKTKIFAEQLKKESGLPVILFDETLSSKTVHTKLAASHMKKSKRQEPIDHYAASEFLQEWLDVQTDL